MEKEMRAKAGRKSNRSMKAARNFAVVVAVTAILAAATAAHAVSVVVEGSTYDIVTFTGTSSSNISRLPESLRVVEIPWGLSPGYAGAELTTAQGSGA